MIVSRYWLPVLVFGSGPTQSMSTWLNGSSKAGIGSRRATGILQLGFPVSWHVLHVRKNDFTSFFRPGQ